jgi:hypothetical protein
VSAISKTNYSNLNINLRVKSYSNSLYIVNSKLVNSNSFNPGIRTIYISSYLTTNYLDNSNNNNNNSIVNNT